MIYIEKPGMLTTIQDLGRRGFQQYGVIVSGAMDDYALQMANILVGNARGEAVLEVTMGGLRFRTSEHCVIAVTGATVNATLNGETLPCYRPVPLQPGDVVQLGQLLDGCRNYIAFRGGIKSNVVMASKSTYLRASLGGYNGRALKRGDTIHVDAHTAEAVRWQAEPPRYNRTEWTIRFTAGPEWAQFTEASQQHFTSRVYQVTPAADRMGYRLNGPGLARREATELLSDAVLFGTIQVSNDGQPTVLLADRQTTGGYARIAQVIASDVHLFGQMKPGDSIRFTQISLDDSYRALYEQIQHLRILTQGIRFK